MKTGGHVRVDLFYGKYSGRIKAFVDMLFNILGTLFTLVFLTGNVLLLRQFYVRGTISTTTLQIPLGIPAIVIVIGSLLLLFQMVMQLSGIKEGD
jgi:TRAP-type C4-dicarboxylate transport system permease small subunit